MLLALDVGNTNITVGTIREAEVTLVGRALTSAGASADELAETLDGILEPTGASLEDVDAIALASVVPDVSVAVMLLAKQLDIEVLVADHRTVPMLIRVDQPSTVGDDRLVNALAAARLFGTPAIVVDLGTATTFDVVSADGAFIGGAIAPGLGLGLEALTERTAQLPRVPLVMPPHAIARDTVSAMQSGAIIGYLGLITALVHAMTAELALEGGDPPKVVVTGGLSNSDWAQAIPGVDAIDPLLTLRGLAILHAELGRKPQVAQA